VSRVKLTDEPHDGGLLINTNRLGCIALCGMLLLACYGLYRLAMDLI
jgi:hypothetical protein